MFSNKMNSSENIEAKFDKFFLSNNYLRVSNVITSTENIKNADYISSNKKFIVELKVIEKKFLKEGGIIERFRAIVPRDKEIFEKGGITTFSIPDENREGEMDNFEEPIRRILKKANRQIRETNKILADNEGIGILILVLIAENVNPNIYVEMVCALLNEEFSSIRGFILISSFTPFKDEKTNRFHPYCFLRWPYKTKRYVKKEIKRLGKSIYQYFSVETNEK